MGWASMLAHLTEWSEDHYRLSAQDFLAQLLAALSAREERFDLDHVLGYMACRRSARIDEVAKRIEDALTGEPSSTAEPSATAP